MHAVVISATYRALAGIVAGCGINHEADFVEVRGDAREERAPRSLRETDATSDAASAANRAATESVAKRLQQSKTDDDDALGGAELVEQFTKAGDDDTGSETGSAPPHRPPPLPANATADKRAAGMDVF